jgi:UMF1 family MFS transporter
LAALVLALFMFVQVDTPPWGLDKSQAEHIRITAPLVSLWFVVFAVPLFLWVPDRPRRDSLGQALRHARQDMAHLWATLRSHPTIGQFLIARMIYIDGLNTLFAFGGIYAAGTFGMSFTDIIILGIALNVSAGIGAAAFGWLDDRIGARATITLSLLAVIGLSSGLLVIESSRWFWMLAVPMGLFFGPAQSASRSMMARLAPAELRTEMFGLFALSGKITSFAGPLVLAWVTAITDNQRLGMATILFFLIGGLVLLRRLPTKG